jgi:membrane protein
MKAQLRDFWQILKSAGKGFIRHKVPKLSASLCFYALFSLGPMLLIIIFISGLFWGQQAIEGSIFREIEGFIGSKAAVQIQELIKNTTISENNFMAVVGIVTLIFAATTGFYEIHDSINTIWNLKVKKGRAWKRMLKTRLLSFIIITGLGIMLLFFLIINGIIEKFMGSLRESFPDAAVVAVYIVNISLTLIIVSFLFAFVFKLLPDAYIKWKYVITGSIFTAILFMIGKYGFTFYINQTDMGSAYGPAGSLVVLILWIYYSATILYFGAEFTKAYSIKYGDEIRPKEYAVTIKVSQIESNESSIQKNEEKQQ